MNSDLNGRWFRSRTIAWASGTQPDIDLSFLAGARHMAAPEVAELVFTFRGTVTPVGGNALGRDFAKLFDNITFRDEAEMINASGATLRCLAEVELGSKFIDPNDVVLGAPANQNFRLPILFEPLDTRAERPRDFRVPLANFLEGGSLVVSMAAANPTNFGVVAGDWDLTVFVRVVDGRKRELKSRRRIFDAVINQQEFDYSAFGAIRTAIITSKLTTTGYTSLAGFANIFSRTLDLPPSFQTHILVDQYRRSSDALGANDEFTLAAPGAIPLVIPTRAKKIGTMIQVKTLHLDLLAAAPASGRFLLDMVVDRTPNMAALGAGYGRPEDLATAVAARGRVVGSNGNMKATEVPRELAKKMPVRVD